jgi:hypothetical protein
MIARIALAFSLLLMAIVSASAQTQFNVCEGEYKERCPRNLIRTGRGATEATSKNLCQPFSGSRHVKTKYRSFGGNRCGYNMWKIVCQ